MRILIFSTAYLPFIGGAELAVREITNHLAAKVKNGQPKYGFDLITSRLDRKCRRRERIENVSVFRVGFGNRFDKFLLPFLGLIKAVRLNRKNSYEIIWAVMASQGGITASFFKLIFPKKIMLLNMQEGDSEEHLRRYSLGSDTLFKIFVQPFHRLVIKKADSITAISNDLGKRAKNSGAGCDIKIVPNGVDINKFERKNPPPLSEELEIIYNLKASLGILKDEKIITTVSRLVKKNGLEDLIRGIKLLADSEAGENSSFKLLIIGTGELEKILKSMVRESGLENKVIFIGKVPNDEVPKYLWISDIFIRPSLTEGLGNVFLEAMAAGLPVVATPVGGIVDFLKDGETGVFCRPGDPQSIKESLVRILNDETLKQKLAANGKKLVREKYDWDIIASKMDDIFSNLVYNNRV
ncbi:MAG: glycosyltransferase family 4 protein [Patescibacteria group bacterium]|jgi:glycosyltransferase involved in cell wall biosynthesis